VIRIQGMAVGAVLLSGVMSCSARNDPETITNENKHLHGIVEEQSHRIDTLTADRATLDRRVQELEAQMAKVDSTSKAVADAKAEIS